jgi:acyl-coenzyme A synthetase/AMP-(fatty) acid ligase
MPSVDDAGPWPPCPAPFNLAAHVLAGGADRPERMALVVVSATGAERWSHGRLTAAVLGAGTGLRRAGVGPGERVLLRLGNTAAFPIAFLGSVAVGALPVPVSAALTAPEIAALLPGLAPRLILADPALPLPADLPCPVLGPSDIAGWERLPPAAFELGDPGRPAFLVFTSGTSGRPRAVVHAHRAIWARGMMRAGWHGIGSGDRVLHAGAMNWTYTLGTGLLDPWTQGATALVPAEGTPAAALPLLLRRHEATIFAASPAIFRRILAEHATLDLPALRHALSAGERLPPQLRARWEAATGRPLHEALGMTECSTFVSGAPGRPAPEGSAGYAQPGRRVAVLDPAGRPVPRGTPGELAVSRRDPGLFLTYLGAEDEAAARFAGEWFRTGDAAVMAADGAVTHLGRLDEMMNAGGVRVSPLEVEAALAAIPGIAEIAVAEVPVRPDVTVIGAFYTGPAPLDPGRLDAFAAQRLARWKRPRFWRHLPELPRTRAGKTDRRALAALGPVPAEEGRP